MNCKTIPEVLAAISVPVSDDPYHGKASTYIVYTLIGQTGQLYAEGREAETCVAYAVDIFSPGRSIEFMLQVKRLLEDSGYIVTVQMENYDHDTDRHQTSLLAEIEGAVYG